MVTTNERRLRTSEALVAGVAAMLVATALFGLVYVVRACSSSPPFGLAQRLLRLVPGPVAVFFIDRLGHWALRLFAVGFIVGRVLAGGGAGGGGGRAGGGARGRGGWWRGRGAAVAAGRRGWLGGCSGWSPSAATGGSRGRPRCWSMARWWRPGGGPTPGAR